VDDPAIAVLRRRAHEASQGVDWSRVDDHAVVDFVGWAAPSAGEGLSPTLSKATPAAAAAPPPAAPARPRAAESDAPASTPLLSVNLDAAAMAQTLREAAQSGAPFCEECERLRQQQRAAA
jgi:hypothetical protein